MSDKSKMVKVEWEDSAGRDGWASEVVPGPHVIETVGYAMRDDDVCLTVCESLTQTDRTDVKRYGCSMAIPRSAVRRIWEPTGWRLRPKR